MPDRMRILTCMMLFILAAKSSLGHASSPNLQTAPEAKAFSPKIPDAIDLEGLASLRSWRKLLFLPDKIIGKNIPALEDPTFFFTKGSNHAVSATQELFASIAAFAQPVSNYQEDEHPQCQFPARWEWVREHLGHINKNWPRPTCAKLNNFLNIATYQQVQLVFTNYYVNNPASMFGHTFLKLRRTTGQKGENSSELLDDAVNFSASVPPGDFLLYPVKGLLGGYYGFFSLFPYHRKVQEYSNFESRDLWEYPLDLSQKEVNRLSLVLWEVGGKKTPYYYFTQNCSFLILSLLEAAAPRLRLTGGYPLFAVPADTLRRGIQEAGLKGPPQPRPSSMSRWAHRLSQLRRGELENVENLLISDTDFEKKFKLPAEHSDNQPPCTMECQKRVFDAALEFFEFEERLAGDHSPRRYGRGRTQVLLARSRIPEPPYFDGFSNTSTPPHRGHPSSLAQWGIGWRGGKGFASLRLRPAVQDFSDFSDGYNRGMELQFFDGTLRYQEEKNGKKKLILNDLIILAATSLPSSIPMTGRLGWNYSLGVERFQNEREEFSHRGYIQGGPSTGMGLWKEQVYVYGSIDLDLGMDIYGHDRLLQIGPLATLGVFAEFADMAKVHLKFQKFGTRDAFHKGMSDQERMRMQNTLLLRLCPNLGSENMIERCHWYGYGGVNYESGSWENMVGFRTYF